MDLPNSASKFDAFMQAIWEGTCTPGPDGNGLIMSKHPEYDKYHNAMKTIRMCSAKRTGGSYLNDKSAEVFRFEADNDQLSVVVQSDGNAFDIKQRRIRRINKD